MKAGSLIAFILFVLVAIAHLVRLVLGAEVTVEGNTIPQWVSLVGSIVPALVAFQLWRESKG